MPPATDREITRILAELNTNGHDSAVARLLPLVYGELRALSGAYLSQERTDHTLQATALVHEAYLRLAAADSVHWEGRAHFFRVAAKTMRRILINHAEKHRAAKRGGGSRGLVLEESMALAAGPGAGPGADIEDLDRALVKLAAIDPEKAQLVELRFFAGCTIEETAEVMGISVATVQRHWRFARAWLRAELEP